MKNNALAPTISILLLALAGSPAAAQTRHLQPSTQTTEPPSPLVVKAESIQNNRAKIRPLHDRVLAIATTDALPGGATPALRKEANATIRHLRAGDTDAAMKSWERAISSMGPARSAQYRESTMDFILRSAYIETNEDLKYRADKVKFYNEQKLAAYAYRDELRAADITLKRGDVGAAKKPAPYANITLERGVVNAPAPPGDITLKRGDIGAPNAPAPRGDITLKRGVVGTANEPRGTGDVTLKRGVVGAASEPRGTGDVTLKRGDVGAANAPRGTGDVTLKRGVVGAANAPRGTGDVSLKRGVIQKSVRVTAIELAPEYRPGIAPITSTTPADTDIDSVVDELAGITVLCSRVEEKERQAITDLQNALQQENRQFNLISNIMKTNPIPPTPPKP